MGYWSIVVPERGENLFANPSFEVDNSGVILIGAGTLAERSATQSRRGAYSLEVIPDTGVNDGVYISFTGVAGSAHTCSFDFLGVDGIPYKAVIYDGTDILGTLDFAGDGAWHRYSLTATAGAITTLRLYVQKNDSADVGAFYVDGLLGLQKDHDLLYFDGDSPGARWEGAKHGSLSTRDGQYRGGGRVINLDTYSLYVEDVRGIGMPPITYKTQEIAFVPGRILGGYKVESRPFEIVGSQMGSSLSNLHSLQKDLGNVLKPDQVKGVQPFTLHYTGANSERAAQIECYYDGGLNFNNLAGYTEKPVIKLAAIDDPFFRDEYDSVSHLISKETLTGVNYILMRKDGQWQKLAAGFNGLTNVAIKRNGLLYFAGGFTRAGIITDANRVAAWDGVSFQKFGGGLGSSVNGMVVAPNGDIYCVGYFTTLGDGITPARYVAWWNGSTWAELGGGLNDYCWDIAMDHDGNLYIVGEFTDVYGGPGGTYNHIIKWDGSAWSAVGSGLDATGDDVIVGHDNSVYVVGSFSSPYAGIAKWDGSAWSGLENNAPSSIWYNTITVDRAGRVWLGGAFSGEDRVGYWNGKTWISLEGDFGTNITKIAIDETGKVYVSGYFTAVGDLDAAKLALWNGFDWAHFDLIPSGSVLRVWYFDGILYFIQSSNGATPVSYINTVVNNGSTLAYPKFVVSRSGGTSAKIKRLENTTTGKVLYLDYPLLDGEELTIDFSKGEQVFTSSFFGKVPRAVLGNSDAGDFYLLPGDNKIALFVDDVGSPTIASYLLWRNAHWSADGVAL